MIVYFSKKPNENVVKKCHRFVYSKFWKTWSLLKTQKISCEIIGASNKNSNATLEMVFCYQNCSDPLLEKKVLVIEKNFLNLKKKIEITGTVKGQNNFQ